MGNRHDHKHGGLDLQAHALSKLRETRNDLLCARVAALQVNLSGARAQRARELTEKIADALAHTERLIVFRRGRPMILLNVLALAAVAATMIFCAALLANLWRAARKHDDH